MPPRSDGSRDPRVDAYIDALPDWQQAICQRLRDLIHEADPEIEETIKRTVQPYFMDHGTGRASGRGSAPRNAVETSVENAAPFGGQWLGRVSDRGSISWPRETSGIARMARTRARTAAANSSQ